MTTPGDSFDSILDELGSEVFFTLPADQQTAWVELRWTDDGHGIAGCTALDGTRNALPRVLGGRARRLLSGLSEFAVDEARRIGPEIGAPGAAGLRAWYTFQRHHSQGWRRCGVTADDPRSDLEPRSVSLEPDLTPWTLASVDYEAERPEGLPPIGLPLRHREYLELLDEGRDIWTLTGRNIDIHRLTSGRIAVSSGKLAVWDPDGSPLENGVVVALPPGHHRWEMVQADVDGDGVEDPVAVIVRIGARDPVAWSTLRDPAAVAPEGDRFHGLLVAGSRIAIMDVRALTPLRNIWSSGAAAYDAYLAKLDSHLGTRLAATSNVPAARGVDVLVARAFGAGRLPVYVGLDSRERVCRVVIDIANFVGDLDTWRQGAGSSA